MMTSLTKDQLRNELINHGVELPIASSKKEELVKLYKLHVLPVQEAAGEFSSDDEAVLPETNGNGHSEGLNGACSDIDIATLSNSELHAKLKSLGVTAGPVVDTTRRLYERKLADVLNVDAPTNGANGDNGANDVDRFSSDEEDLGQGDPEVPQHGEEELQLDDTEEEVVPEVVPEVVEVRPPTPPVLRSRLNRSGVSSPVVAGAVSSSAPPETRRRTVQYREETSLSSVTGRSVQPVYLTGNEDTPSPRRALKHIHAAGSSAGAPMQTRFARTITTVNSGRSSSTTRSTVRSVLVLLTLSLAFAAAAYYVFQYMKKGGTAREAFASIQRAAGALVKNLTMTASSGGAPSPDHAA